MADDRAAWIEIPNLALDGLTDDGPAIEAALDAAEADHRDDLDAYLGEAMKDPLFAWWRRWHRLTRAERAGEKRVAASMARTRRRAARQLRNHRTAQEQR